MTTVTFILAVLLTALAFICCRKYWKERERNVEIHETHFYRMACSSSSAPLVSSPFGASFHSNGAQQVLSPLATSPPALLEPFQAYPSSMRRPGQEISLALIDPPGYPPPPPYQSHPSLDRVPSTTNVAIVAAAHKAAKRKPLWRTLSQ